MFKEVPLYLLRTHYVPANVHTSKNPCNLQRLTDLCRLWLGFPQSKVGLTSGTQDHHGWSIPLDRVMADVASKGVGLLVSFGFAAQSNIMWPVLLMQIVILKPLLCSRTAFTECLLWSGQEAFAESIHFPIFPLIWRKFTLMYISPHILGDLSSEEKVDFH